MSITYNHTQTGLGPVIRVFLDGKIVGTILREVDQSGFYYAPKRGTRGEKFESIIAVKRSLESAS